jgi:hypothetical protein
MDAPFSRRGVIVAGGAALAAAAGTRLVPRPFRRPEAQRALLDAEPIDVAHDYPVPRIVTRAEWGADESLRRAGPTFDASVTKLVVHHTVTPSPADDSASWIRQIYREQTSTQWTDIAYHWVVDVNGTVYEGRWARDYPHGTAPNGEDPFGRSVHGGATEGHNTGTIAVAVLGNYMGAPPTPATLDSIVDLFTWKAMRWGIDPLGATPYHNDSGGYEILPNIVGHRECSPTLCPGNMLQMHISEIRRRVAQRVAGGGRGGYWIVTRDGKVEPIGDVPALVAAAMHAPLVDAQAHGSGNGLWLLTADGGVYALGRAKFHGSPARLPDAGIGARLAAPVVSMAVTPTGDGYWIAGSDGGVFAYGDATFHGSLAGIWHTAPVVAITATPTGRGYWLATADGGVFAYGDAHFAGSAASTWLRAPIVAMASTPSGRGYWLAAQDGGVFAYGDAPFHGSGPTPGRPIAAIAGSSSGQGYVLLASDGGVQGFGDAAHHSARGGRVHDAAVLTGRVTGKAEHDLTHAARRHAHGHDHRHPSEASHPAHRRARTREPS